MPQCLDVRAFARAAGQLQGQDALAQFPRLADELHEPTQAAVAWNAAGEMRPGSLGAEPEIWLHLTARTLVPLQCQRCLGTVETPVEVDRWFRFVADEATAEAQDDECEEDVLALESGMSLPGLIEDELLMALPLVPMHEACPTPVVTQASDPAIAAEEADATPRHPFAALARLKK